MIFINDVRYVKVWEVTKHERYIKLQVSTSDKKQDGTYENSGWYVNLVGQAFTQGQGLTKGDTITINKGKISNVYNKEKQTSYLNLVAFDIEVTNSNQQSVDNSQQNEFNGFQAVDEDEDIIPF